MMDKELFSKMVDEQALTAEESLRLDSALESPLQRHVAGTVASLPDEAPSLSWRSELNQRLVKVSKVRRAAPWWRFGVAAAAMAAASFAILSLMQPGVAPGEERKGAVAENVRQPSLEDAILAEHNDARDQASLGIHVSYGDTRL